MKEKKKKSDICQTQWFIPIIPVLRKQRQKDDPKFEDSLKYCFFFFKTASKINFQIQLPEGH